MDKRGELRARSNELIKLVSIDQETQQESWQVTNICDISKSGISFYLDKEIKPSGKVAAVIHAPQTDQNVSVELEIVRRKRAFYKNTYRIGAKFTQMADSDWLKIQKQGA